MAKSNHIQGPLGPILLVTSAALAVAVWYFTQGSGASAEIGENFANTQQRGGVNQVAVGLLVGAMAAGLAYQLGFRRK